MPRVALRRPWQERQRAVRSEGLLRADPAALVGMTAASLHQLWEQLGAARERVSSEATPLPVRGPFLRTSPPSAQRAAPAPLLMLPPRLPPAQVLRARVDEEVSARVASQVAERVAEAVSESSMCGICMERAMDVAIDPCGHRLCAACAQRISACHVCRTPVRSRLRVF